MTPIELRDLFAAHVITGHGVAPSAPDTCKCGFESHPEEDDHRDISELRAIAHSDHLIDVLASSGIFAELRLQ